MHFSGCLGKNVETIWQQYLSVLSWVDSIITLERCTECKSSESEMHGLGKLYLCSKIQGHSLEALRPTLSYLIKFIRYECNQKQKITVTEEGQVQQTHGRLSGSLPNNSSTQRYEDLLSKLRQKMRWGYIWENDKENG